jgi:hypothetical protein
MSHLDPDHGYRPLCSHGAVYPKSDNGNWSPDVFFFNEGRKSENVLPISELQMQFRSAVHCHFVTIMFLASSELSMTIAHFRVTTTCRD